MHHSFFRLLKFHFSFFLFILLANAVGTNSALAQTCNTEDWVLNPVEKITLYLYPQRIAKLEEHNNIARLAYYLGYTYNDNQFKGVNCVLRGHEIPGWAFDAQLEIMNADDRNRLSDISIRIDDTEVYVEWKEASDFYQHYDLTYYPFDRQSITLDISSNYLISEMRMAPFDGFGTALENIRSQKVHIQSGSSKTSIQNWDGDKYDLVSFRIHVVRDWLSSSVRLGLPMLLIFITAVIAFARLKSAETFEPAVQILGTCQLAIVAYLFVIEQRVPEVGYLTMFDYVTLGLFLIVTALLVLAIKHRYVQQQNE